MHHIHNELALYDASWILHGVVATHNWPLDVAICAPSVAFLFVFPKCISCGRSENAAALHTMKRARRREPRFQTDGGSTCAEIYWKREYCHNRNGSWWAGQGSDKGRRGKGECFVERLHPLELQYRRSDEFTATILTSVDRHVQNCSTVAR